jgi:hypothetical protein
MARWTSFFLRESALGDIWAIWDISAIVSGGQEINVIKE